MKLLPELKNSSEVVVPKDDRKEIIDELHSTHMSAEGMKKLARGRLTWKGMSKEIKRKYDECEACLENSRSKPNVPNHRSEVIPSNLELTAPGEKLSADFGEYGRNKLMIVKDRFSGLLHSYGLEHL